MRLTISGVVAALAMLAASTASAAACGGYQHGCAPCAAYVAPCGYHAGHSVRYVRADVAYERLPTIAIPRWRAMPRYYHVNQGPVYSGPGNFAPLPVYREGSVSTPDGYGPVYGRHRHHSGLFADLTSRHHTGVPHWNGPVIYSSAPHGPARAYRPRASRHGGYVRAHAHRHHHHYHHGARHHHHHHHHR